MRSATSLRLILAVSVLAAFASAEAGIGTYLFNSNLNAVESGAPSLTAVDPLSQNAFGTQFLYGANRTTYNTSGTGSFANNAGLLLNAASLTTATQYSLEMVVSLAATTGFRKLADVSGRSLDTGYYVLDSHQNVYNVVTGGLSVPAATYNYLTLTVSGNTVKGYVNGALDFTTTTTVMNGNSFAFFLDDSAQGSEYSNVSVALLRLRDSVLSDGQVRDLAQNPFVTAPVPEPASLVAVGLGALALVRRRRR